MKRVKENDQHALIMSSYRAEVHEYMSVLIAKHKDLASLVLE